MGAALPKKLGQYQFQFVTEIQPERNPNTGEVRKYRPHMLYEKANESEILYYGKGPFCKFVIPNSWSNLAGVYAIFSGDNLLYIGQTVDFAKRFNAGYGNISPRNCYAGGQSTNCKINNLILQEILTGANIYLYFHQSDDYDAVERMLIADFTPPFNGHTPQTKHTSSKPTTAASKIMSDGLPTGNLISTIIPDIDAVILWDKICSDLSSAKDICTISKKGRCGIWFSAQRYDGGLLISNAEHKHNEPCSKLRVKRTLFKEEFIKTASYYKPWRNDRVSRQEVADVSQNSSYIFGLIAYYTLP
ncbi:MAG: GIY-YIG nuclease family protein [Clostridiales Family XIII bacterium]|jgi:hypothetical protein|nr:GIY-YIG nuclease family protein [Clostridiales Family XIII bacterium]